MAPPKVHAMAYQIVRFPHDGTIDADGHVLEPDWLWREYLEAGQADHRWTYKATVGRARERHLSFAGA